MRSVPGTASSQHLPTGGFGPTAGPLGVPGTQEVPGRGRAGTQARHPLQTLFSKLSAEAPGELATRSVTTRLSPTLEKGSPPVRVAGLWVLGCPAPRPTPQAPPGSHPHPSLGRTCAPQTGGIGDPLVSPQNQKPPTLQDRMEATPAGQASHSQAAPPRRQWPPRCKPARTGPDSRLTGGPVGPTLAPSVPPSMTACT